MPNQQHFVEQTKYVIPFVLFMNIAGCMAYPPMILEIWTNSMLANLVFVVSMALAWYAGTWSKEFWFLTPVFVLIGYICSSALAFGASWPALQWGWGGIILAGGSAYMFRWSFLKTQSGEMDLEKYAVDPEINR